jgi:hypothetical protein
MVGAIWSEARGRVRAAWAALRGREVMQNIEHHGVVVRGSHAVIRGNRFRATRPGIRMGGES